MTCARRGDPGMITIRHTPAEGTLVEGTRRGDGSAELLKARRFKWSRNLGCWYVPHSRDRQADTYRISGVAGALREAGFEVAIEVDDDETRSFAEAEQERYERAEDRADRFGGYAENAAVRSHAAWERSNQIAGRFEAGQPILAGHHSERRARADQARIHAAMSRSAEEDRKAGYWLERAKAAGDYQARRESVPATLRRIEGLEAEERSWERALKGEPDSRTLLDAEGGYRTAEGRYRERAGRELARIRGELDYWRGHVKKRQDEGVKVWSAADFTKGDFVLYHSRWFEVLRVNGKSVTIPAMINDGPVVTKAGARLGWADTVPYHKVRGRKPAEEMPAILAENEEASCRA